MEYGMLRNLLITVGILLGLLLVGYLLAMLPAGPEQDNLSSTTPTTPTIRDRSWLGDMYHAWKVTRPKDDGIRREGSNRPDSDTSECVGVTKTSDQMITTRFAGHILRYPCTANHDGHWSVNYNQNDEVIYQNHALYLRVLIRPEKETIWRRSFNEHGTKRDAFKVQLSSNGEKITNEPIKMWIAGATKLAVFDSINIVVYLNGNDLKGFILDQMNDLGGYPNISCTGSTANRALKLFDPNLPPHVGSSCSVSWNLNDYIKVHVLMFDSLLARDFEFFYRKINQGLKETIIKEPKGLASSNQEK